jgi:hypothetical protein
MLDDAVEADSRQEQREAAEERREHGDEPLLCNRRFDESIESLEPERNGWIGLGQRRSDTALDSRALARRRVDSQENRGPEVLWRLLRHGDVHRRLHALARGCVDGIADNADDLAVGVGFESLTHDALSERLLTRQVLTHERLVDDGNGTAAHAVARLEVPAAAQRNAHRFEPVWCRGIQKEWWPTPDYRTIADADHTAHPTAPCEALYRGDRS